MAFERARWCVPWLLLLFILMMSCVGCTRSRYRLRADQDSYGILGEKTATSPWQLTGFTISVDPRSRLFDPSPPDAPRLPIPAPRLYAYELPEISNRDPARFRASTSEPFAKPNSVIQPVPASTVQIAQASYEIFRLPSEPEVAQLDGLQLAVLASPQSEPPGRTELPEPRAGDGNKPLVSDASQESSGIELGGLRLVALKKPVWDAVPDKCLRRMLEFQSIRDEYARTYDQPADQLQFDDAPRAALEDLLELSILNSREYQTRKEQLYQAALQLSLERYEYQIKFLPTGNSLNVDWSHRRDGGATVNSLATPSAIGLDKVLATGGTFLARFANEILLTFNGVDGFSADVSSELFTELSQRLLQRDIVFEQLTAAERDVVYSARGYARFRKTFFRDIARSYYELLLTYRGIEIDTLDYFSNQRGFDQAQAEERAGSLPRFQVDQFEQNALASRSRLVRSCNSLERGLDELKLRLGLPPETPLNLDLQELEQITLGDQTAVARELVRRAQRTVLIEQQEAIPDQRLLVSSGTNLARRIVDLLQLQHDGDDVQRSAVEKLLTGLRVQETRLVVQRYRQNLNSELQAERPRPLNIFQRRMDLIRTLLDLASLRVAAGDLVAEAGLLDALAEDFERLREGLDTIQDDLDQIPQLVQQSADLLQRTIAGVDDQPGADREAQMRAQVDLALDFAEQVLSGRETGLSEIILPVDDGMLTALVSRFDLMNERGFTADAWRQVKLASDDLRSVLNLRASQSVRTRPDVNRPFDFTWDEGETQAGLTFDAPLNRRAQRNAYRAALISYQQALRNLMLAEDEIKLGIRNNLRDLELDRDQYVIAVASAALANERVYSTRLQLQLGLGNVTARDFLEAQQAYTASLSNVASQRIGYILDRIELFLNIELLEVDEAGFWPQLYDEAFQPSARYEPPVCSGPAYGRLPAGVRYSTWLRSMENIPFGNAMLYGTDPGSARDSAAEVAIPRDATPEAAQ